MAFDITEAKAKARRQVHRLAAAPATYEDDTLGAPVAITVRWHNRIIPSETINDTSEIITGIERLVFSEEELAAMDPPLTLLRGGIVTIPKYDNMQFELSFEEPNDGPVTTAWSVSSIT
ncbi:hypothetical protein [Sphingomonas phage Carli]|nr:hypothetical protein [Sphingomonas phage Carli]